MVTLSLAGGTFRLVVLGYLRIRRCLPLMNSAMHSYSRFDSTELILER